MLDLELLQNRPVGRDKGVLQILVNLGRGHLLDNSSDQLNDESLLDPLQLLSLRVRDLDDRPVGLLLDHALCKLVGLGKGGSLGFEV